MITRPQRTRTEHELPFERLSPRDFERLCLGLVQQEGYEDVRHLGAAGGEQGRDIVAVRAGRRVAFQCKRVRAFTAADAEIELAKLLTLPERERPDEYVFLVTSDVSARTREQAQERAGAMVCCFWALTELDQLVRRHPNLVHQFFGLLAGDDELKEIRRLLDDKTAKLPANAPPSLILTADYEVVPFDEVGRREELELLAAFCGEDQEGGQKLLLFTGEGGIGKTRLLIEWCRRLRQEGWHAGFLRSDRRESDLDSLVEGTAPRLVVVDYAETRLSVVKELLLKVGLAPAEGPTVRIVLLARQAGGWWDSLRQQTERPIEDLLLNSPPPRQLTPLVPDLGERLLAFRSTTGAFAATLGRELPESLATPDLSDPAFERALYLHMAALAALEGERIENARDALERTLNRERRFWGYHIGELGLDGLRRRQMEKAIESAVAVLTFLGGATDEQQGREIVSHVLAPLALTADLEAGTLEMLKHLYGNPNEERSRFLEPLKPDLLGEQLVVERWAQDAVPWQDLLLRKRLGGDRATTDALTRLTRLAQRRPDTLHWLQTALRKYAQALASSVLDVAVETGDPIGFVFAEILQEEDFILLARTMILADHEIYQRSIPLREVALVATSKVLEILKARWGRPNPDQNAELTRLSINLGQRLRDLGRHEEALQITQEAVHAYRQFVKRDRNEFLPHLASGLNNLGTLLSELGQREEALGRTDEALQIYRQLAQGSRNYDARLAACLDNLANRLSELGRQQEALQKAEEGLQIRRDLVEKMGHDHLPDLANSLNNLGGHLKAVGLNEEAVQATREAAEIRRELAAERSDAFLPDLATSLSNLGALLASLGRQEEAIANLQAAVAIWRRFAERRPDAFLSDLAGSLENFGIALGDLGRNNEALDVLFEAREIYGRLVETRPGIFEPKLAQSLSSLSNALSDAGRNREALSFVQESEALFRRLAQQRPKVFLSGLAGSLVNLGNRLAEDQKLEDALRRTREAVELYRQLAQERPEVFSPDLATAAMALGNRLREGGQIEEALEITGEAVALYRKLAAQNPDAFLPLLARCLNNLGLQLRDDGKVEDSRLCFEEAIRLLAPFFLRRPAGFLPWMRVVVQNYREVLHELGQAPDEELLQPLRGHLQMEM